MENSKIDFGKIILRILVLLIVKPFVLPIRIYKNTLQNLSNVEDENSNEKLLETEFPFYVWLIDLFDAIIALTYPVGICFAIYIANENDYKWEEMAFKIIVFTYFVPLAYGFVKELFSITLKTLSYLKIISNK